MTTSTKDDAISDITNTLSKAELGISDVEIIDTATAMATVIESLKGLAINPPSLYVDIEGIYLSRLGSVSILQIYVLPTNKTYLIDVHVLGSACFSTPGKDGDTLKDIFQSEAIPKVFFDVRNDSDALYAHYNIHLGGIQDLQLMELGTRSPLVGPRRFVRGLSRCIEMDAPLSMIEKVDWLQTKDRGVKLFAPEKGGSYQVFNERPMKDIIKAYCANDVWILPRLWTYYDGKLLKKWREKMIVVSATRVRESHKSTYNGKGQHMAVAPRGW